MILGRRGPREREDVVIIILGEEAQGEFFYYESSLEIYCIFACSKNPW